MLGLHTIPSGLKVAGFRAYLCVDAHILEEASHTSEALVEVGPFLEGAGDGLENLLVLFGVSFVDFLGGRDVLLQVDDSVFPCLESLGEEAGGLSWLVLLSRPDFLGKPHPGLTVVGSRLGTASSVVPKVEPCRIGRLEGSPLIFFGCSLWAFIYWLGLRK